MRYWTWLATATAALALSACSGGSGGGETQAGTGETPPATTGPVVTPPAPVPGTPGVPVTPTQPTPPGQVTLRGNVAFEAVAVNPGTGLDYAHRTLKPARTVQLDVVDLAGKVLTRGSTDASGNYAVSVPVNSVVKVRITARMGNAAAGTGQWYAEVADNTDGDRLYGVIVPATIVDKTDLVRNITIPGARPDALIDGRLAAPFAILDTIYENQARVPAPAPGAVVPPLTVFWSEKNRPSTRSNPATGEFPAALTIAGEKSSLMVLMGKAGVDTDEYDASVISHEWAHYYQGAFGRTDSLGGAHARDDLLDRGIAFAEGFATAWSGIALKSARYVDSYGPGDAETFTIDLDTAPTANTGWFNQESIRYVVWKLHDSAGLEPILQALAGSFRSTVASGGIHLFNTSLVQAAPAAAARFAALLRTQNIEPVTDAWGTGETNDGGSPVALPMVRVLQAGAPASGVCVSNALDPRNERNKLGEYTYLRFDAASAGEYIVRATGGGTSEPELKVWGAAPAVVRIDSVNAGARGTVYRLEKGDHLIRLTDKSFVSASPCFDVVVSSVQP